MTEIYLKKSDAIKHIKWYIRNGYKGYSKPKKIKIKIPYTNIKRTAWKL